MRGKVTFLIDTVFPARITPAYAGKSLEISLTQQACQDHPRLCGEKNASDCGQAMRAGSPPPMRGKVSPVLVRAIPDTDHPRLCGEKGNVQIIKTEKSGSPPPMRGKARLSGTCRTRARITPAYAGKRFGIGFLQEWQWDHPRLCGEKLQTTDRNNYHWGSPPPMRGKDEIPM